MGGDNQKHESYAIFSRELLMASYYGLTGSVVGDDVILWAHRLSGLVIVFCMHTCTSISLLLPG